ncbi:hypothetical protein BHM03_00019761 [Ensete ventricosum]|uniref:Uncharacterized protein n=1 Tax=Ensete ventricosum TaxID=4639 RepID=A0A445MFV0_ENSVE|nr:hypothetical protein BHM03_00019761 [Ensete ventricosum]
MNQSESGSGSVVSGVNAGFQVTMTGLMGVGWGGRTVRYMPVVEEMQVAKTSGFGVQRRVSALFVEQLVCGRSSYSSKIVRYLDVNFSVVVR